MRITVVAVGQRQPAWAQDAVDDYLARFPADFKVELKEVKAEPRSGKGNEPVQRLMAAEAARIRAAVPADGRIVALDERGADWTTDKLASALGRWRDEGLHPVFVIGGPDGLDPELKTSAPRGPLRRSSSGSNLTPSCFSSSRRRGLREAR